jgi:hypothetical protein
MTRYVPATKAAELSEALFALARPPAVRQAGEVTKAMCAVIQDLDGAAWILINDQKEVRVHEEAELNGIADLLRPWIGHGIEQADIDALEALVIASRGGRLIVYDAFPQVFKAASRTRAELVAEGKLEPEGTL